MNLQDLYQEVILDHNRSPRNFRISESANRRINGNNPLCGDKITLFLDLQDGIIKDVCFQGSGCAISTASASLMTDALKGMPEAKARETFKHFHAVVTENAEPNSETLGKLTVLAGVKEFPSRVKCATLAWHTLEAALNDSHDTVTTE